MGEKLFVGNISKGLKNDRTAFNIDNDSFPTLVNAYQWRGRVKRKRGTSFLGRLTRFFNSTSISYSATATITLDGSGNGNLLTGFGLEASGNIVPGTVTITDTATMVVYTDPAKDGTLSPSGTINYATGSITIAAAAGHAISVIFKYYPSLPVMGIRDLNLNALQFPGTLEFDTKYSYNQLTSLPYPNYDVTFYKNPPVSAALPGYIPKTNITPFHWNGQDYQLFWTVNYQNAIWATNGIQIPFNNSNIGMQFKPIVSTTIIAGGPPAIVALDITAHGLVVGDFVFVNEVVTTTGINFQTGYVIAVVTPNVVNVEFPNATIATNGTGGIAQYLTNTANPAIDPIRFYDGDPTNGDPNSPLLSGSHGWVNFSPPISNLAFSLDDHPAAQYYLVGARMIIPFKDRLLFLGPVIQTSAAGSQLYLQDTVIFSQNGTPYYTASFTGSQISSLTTFNPILVPSNQTSAPNSYFEDVPGFGGFITAGVAQDITTVGPNEDVLLIGFTNRETRFVYSGNELVPFNFYSINTELGSGSTFSTVVMDRGVYTMGDHGIDITSQIGAQRIDLEIPDQVFEVNYLNNGAQRITSQRDYVNEWIYFTYPSNGVSYKFPNQTLQYNYRDDSWAIFNEAYTAYGQFRRQTGFTWATVGSVYPTWESWNEPWNAGTSTLLQPEVLAGTTQGFIMVRDEGTNEGTSISITSFSGNVITAPNHMLNNGDFIVISAAIGSIAPSVNGLIFQVSNATQNTFIAVGGAISGTYSGGGLITRMYIPFIQTKQFPVAWGFGRKTRIGPQMYLFSTTPKAQIELQIYLSMDGSNPANFGPIVPAPNSDNNALVYTDILFTCPENTNIGLTPANINLQSPEASTQSQIWHRMNTSLIGDTVQIGFTLSQDQMTDPNFNNQFEEIELHGFCLDINPSSLLA